MAVFKKSAEDAARDAGTLYDSTMSQQAQKATGASVGGMEYFRKKGNDPIAPSGTYVVGRGSLFEYIEAAKWNIDSAMVELQAAAAASNVGRTQDVVDVPIQECESGEKIKVSDIQKASHVAKGIVDEIHNMTAQKDRMTSTTSKRGNGTTAMSKGGTITSRPGSGRSNTLGLNEIAAPEVMADGLVNGGAALYSYALGEIDELRLKEQLVDTTAKSTVTVLLAAAAYKAMGKSVKPLAPLAVYATASYVFTAAREILGHAELGVRENERLTAILMESKKQMEEYNTKLKSQLAQMEFAQKRMMENFLNTFNYNLATGENYDAGLNAIVRFADQAGIALQHTSFEEFSDAMRRKDVFILE